MSDDPLTPSRRSRNLSAATVIDTIPDEDKATEIEEATDEYYEMFMCDQIISFAEDMMFPEQWAAELGVSEARMFSWISKFPDFAEAYQVALTRLRAAFMEDLMNAARGKVPFSQPSLYTLIAKKRFRDLFGDEPVAPRDAPPIGTKMVDVTPSDGKTVDYNEMQAEQLRKELEEYRERQG